MNEKQFLNSLANGEFDVVQLLLDILAQIGSRYCVIGGLAVNAYAEPVVSLDIDLVAAVDDLEAIATAASERGLKVEHFTHSLNLSSVHSDLRIQLQTDPRYQDFIPRAGMKKVLGYELSVAAVEDVLQDKVWAYLDPIRRRSKRQKDLADILRLVEARPDLKKKLPPDLQDEIGD
jgi:hypothetical protein